MFFSQPWGQQSFLNQVTRLFSVSKISMNSTSSKLKNLLFKRHHYENKQAIHSGSKRSQSRRLIFRIYRGPEAPSKDKEHSWKWVKTLNRNFPKENLWQEQEWVTFPSYHQGNVSFNDHKMQVHAICHGLPGGSVVKNLPANAGDQGSVPGPGRSPGEGNGNPL